MKEQLSYNAWALKLGGYYDQYYTCLAKYHLFAKSKRGHDDEVNRIVTFKTREKARHGKKYLLKQLSKKNDSYRDIVVTVVKVRVGVTELAITTGKDFI